MKPDKKPITKDTMEDFLTMLEVDGRSTNTVRTYHSVINNYLIFYADHPAAAGDCEDLIMAYKIHLKRNKNYKNRSLRTIVTVLKMFMEYCGYDCHKITMPKVEQPRIKYLSEADIDKLLLAPSGIYAVRDKAIIKLLYASGLRVSELIALDKEDVNFTDRTILVNHGKGGKHRIVMFDTDAGKLLQTMIYKRTRKGRTDKGPALFTNRYGSRLSVRSVQKMIKKAGLDAGISQPVTPHILRHSFAANRLIKGMNIKAIQQLLGHSSLATTQIYTELDNKDLKNEYDKY
jgi:integrase/recombinase XerD